MTPEQARDAAVAFLDGIGIACRKGVVGAAFLDHVRIEKGGLVYDDEAKAADLLHEAGHIAIIPAAIRHLADDDLDRVHKAIAELIERQPPGAWERGDADAQALLQCGESEATAWSFAAGRAAGIPDELIIEDQDFDHHGAMQRLGLATNQHLGINGLRASGMIGSVRDFPTLRRWLQN